MVKTANDIWRDFVTDGVAASGVNEPAKADIREWGTSLEAFYNASGSALIYTTRANLFADLTPSANTLAWVVQDSTSDYNGIYQKVGAASSGSWVRVANLPYSFVRANNTGGGTANAILATTAIPVSESTIVALNIVATNTESPVNVNFNASGSVPILTNSGNNVVVGGLTAGSIVVGILYSGSFRLLSDQASAAVLAASETFANSASASATQANAAAASISPLTSQTFEVTSGTTSVTISGGYTVGKIAAVYFNGVKFNGFTATDGTTVSFPAITANDLADGETTLSVEVLIGTSTAPLSSLDQRYVLKSSSTGGSVVAVQSLSSGTSLNGISSAGIYFVSAPSNAPSSLLSEVWVVEAYNTSTQFVQIAYPINRPSFKWSRSYVSSWSDWVPEGGFVTLEHYGATGTYSSSFDDSQFLYAALNSGFETKLLGTYNLSSRVNCGFGYGGKTVKLVGTGDYHLIVNGVSGGISFYTGTGTQYTGLTATFRDFKMIAYVSGHNSVGLEIVGVSGQGSGYTIKNFEIHNVGFFGQSSSKGIFIPIKVNNGRNGVIRSCLGQGVLDNPPGSRVGSGIWLTGDANPVDTVIDDCKFYFYQHSYKIDGTFEGVKVINSSGVGVDYGVFALLDENPISGLNSGKQLLQVSLCHFNSYLYGIYSNRVWDVHFDNLSLLVEQPNSNYQGIYLNMDGEISIKAHIDNISILDRTTGAVSTGQTIGINISTNNSAIPTSVRIANLSCDWLKYIFFAQPGVTNVLYDASSCIFFSCTNTTGGTGTITAY